MAVHVRFEESGGPFNTVHTLELDDQEVRQTEDGVLTRRATVDPAFVSSVRQASEAVVASAQSDSGEGAVADGTTKRLRVRVDEGEEQMVQWSRDVDPDEVLWELLDVFEAALESSEPIAHPEPPFEEW